MAEFIEIDVREVGTVCQNVNYIIGIRPSNTENNSTIMIVDLGATKREQIHVNESYDSLKRKLLKEQFV